MKPWIKKLPWVAVAAILIFSAILIFGPKRSSFLTPDPQQKQRAQSTLNTLAESANANLEDPAFTEKLNQALSNGTAASLWVFDQNGILVYAQGSTAKAAKNFPVDDLPVQKLLSSLPDEALTPQQKQLLISAALIQVEGEHNDIYNHLVTPLYDASGEMTGILGMAYSINQNTGGVPLSWKLSIVAGLFSFGIYWISLPLWVFFDARSRNEKAWIWGCFTLLGNLIALMAYLLTRHPQAE